MKSVVISILSGSLFALMGITPNSYAADFSWEVRSNGSESRPVELALLGLPVVANPFDPSQANLVATITDPESKSYEIPLYWYQDYIYSQIQNQRREVAVGAPEWRLKFRSLSAGTYRISVDAQVDSKSLSIPSFQVTTDYATVQPIRVKDRHFVQGDDLFIPFAYNVAWANRYEELERYEKWFREASKGGVNVARVWMASWSVGIEWSDTGLGDYTKRLPRAWALDRIYEIASKYGIHINLVLLNHGAFSITTNPEWYSNAYFKGNGGPIDNPGDFATNTVARKYWEQRLRYIVARWAGEPHQFTWEWWNEVNFTPMGGEVLTEWIRWSDSILKKWDPYRSLTTTSWASAASLQDWSPVDYAVVHVYDDKDPIKTLAVQYEAMRNVLPNKPILVGEMGSGTTAEDPLTDPSGLHLHNAHWAATFVGFGAPASYWWWDLYVDPLNLWGITRGLKKLIEGHNTAEMTPKTITGISNTSTLILQDEKTILGWIRHNDHDRSAKSRLLLDASIKSLATGKKLKTEFPPPKVKSSKISLPVQGAGRYQVEFLNTISGKTLLRNELSTSNPSLKIRIPAFKGDIAFRVTKGDV